MRLPLQDGRRLRLGTDISRVSVLLGLLTAGAAVGCANLSDGPDDGPATTVACGDNLTEDGSLLDWELTVMPGQIVAGEDFTASIDGVAKLSEAFLDRALALIEGPVREVNLVELKATVRVYEGAAGRDVTLTADSTEYEYECELDHAECDPANGNDDCDQGLGAPNQCGRFVPLPNNDDCDPGGFCEGKGKMSQCERNDFCIDNDLEIKLGEMTGEYTASAGGGVVLWGWADAGFPVQGSGPNEGTWILPMPAYVDDRGPVSLRVLAGVSDSAVALECTMGVGCKDPSYGVDCRDGFLSSPTPPEALITHPIEPAF